MALLPFKRGSTADLAKQTLALDEDDRLFTDFYHQLLTSSWPGLLLQIAFAFIVVNILFAFGYYLDGGIESAHSFFDGFCSSVETIATIGYGKMSPITTVSHVLMSVEAL